MCGRYSQTLPRETVRRVFDLEDDIPGLRPRFSGETSINVIAASLRLPMIYATELMRDNFEAVIARLL